MAWRGHEASPPASPPRAGYEQAGQDGLDDLAVAALATLPPQKAASILTKLRNKGGNVRNPSAYVVKAVANAIRRELKKFPRPDPRLDLEIAAFADNVKT